MCLCCTCTVFGKTVCDDITEFNADIGGSIEYPVNGVYAADMKCQWRLHAPVGTVSTMFNSANNFHTDLRFTSTSYKSQVSASVITTSKVTTLWRDRNVNNNNNVYYYH